MQKYDSLGAQQLPDDDYNPTAKGYDFRGQILYEDEEVFLYHDGRLIKPDDLMAFFKTLPKEELLEIIETMSFKEMIKNSGVEKTNV